MAKPMLKAALPLSYATRSGNTVRVHLQVDDMSQLTADSTYLRLHHAGRSISTPAARLEMSADSNIARVPSEPLSNGSWRIEVGKAPNGPFDAVPAFILISDPNPIALLLGSPDQMDRLVATPHPVPSARRHIVHRVGGVVDRAVAELPPSAARRSRLRLRKVAQRFLR